MTDETIVAVYDTPEHAALAARDLETAGVPSSAISQHASGGIATGSTTTPAPRHEKGFWTSLFGGEPEYEHDTTVYDRSLESGSTVVTVKAPEQHIAAVMDILERHHPIDIDERAASYGLGSSGTTTTTTTTTTGITKPPVQGTAPSTAPSAAPATATGTGGEEVIDLARASDLPLL